MVMIFKILEAAVWDKAAATGHFSGSTIDLKDGFIHFSDATQAEETAARYFSGQTGLVLVTFDADDFGESLRWETSRGGALFPHLYAPVDPALAKAVAPLPWDGDRHVFPTGWNA